MILRFCAHLILLGTATFPQSGLCGPVSAHLTGEVVGLSLPLRPLVDLDDGLDVAHNDIWPVK
jgi:hypothetical protein